MKEKMIVFDSDFATVWFHPEGKIIHHQFHKFMFGEAFRKTLMSGAAAMEENNATKWLSDDRNNSALGQEDTEWGQTVWLNRVKAAGWKYWAIVLPLKLIGQTNMKKHAEFMTSQGITTKMFSDPDEAYQWLMSVN